MVDGVRTVSTLLSDQEWKTLQADARAGRRSVVLPYCGTRAYLRTSKLGVRHFAHMAVGDCPSHPKESGQHLYAKNIIMQAARVAGWDAETEVLGSGWVADVLASSGARRVAFEVQWSAQTLAEFERRHARYAADGIRCAWFTRHERSVPPPRRDLPVFHMNFSESSVTAVVNATTMTLAEAVTSLLGGRIGFRDHVATGRHATMEVECFEYGCYRCNAISMTWEVAREVLEGPCGTTAEIRHGSLWATDRPEAGPEVRRRVAAEAKRLGVSLANLGSRYSNTAGGTYTAFSCPRCGALFGDWFLRNHMMESRSEDAYLIVTIPGAHDRIPAPHWCVNSGNGQCVDRSPDMRALHAREDRCGHAQPDLGTPD